jgi:predicted dehydrogenase
MITVAIVGSGFGLYGLLPAFRTIKQCNVVAICGKKSERLLNYCKQVGLKNIYTDWKQMINEMKPDVIAIATSPDRQFEIAGYAIKKGIHVFAEKPLTNKLKTSILLEKLAAQYNVHTCVDFIFPEVPEWKKCKEILESKKFGAILNVNVTWNFYGYDLKNKINGWKTDRARGGGVTSFYCSHVLHYLKWFIKDFDIVNATSSTSAESLNKGETSVAFNFKKNKLTGSALVSCHAKGLNRHEIVFQCERGTLILENENSVADNFQLWATDKNLTLRKIKCSKLKGRTNEDERVKYVKSIASKFISAVKANRNMAPNFTDGVVVQKQITEIQRRISGYE